MLPFVVLFFVYPLKSVFSYVIALYTSGVPYTTLADGVLRGRHRRRLLAALPVEDLAVPAPAAG